MSSIIRTDALRTNPATASEAFYDAVIVGSGVSGAIIAKELARAASASSFSRPAPGTI